MLLDFNVDVDVEDGSGGSWVLKMGRRHEAAAETYPGLAVKTWPPKNISFKTQPLNNSSFKSWPPENLSFKTQSLKNSYVKTWPPENLSFKTQPLKNSSQLKHDPSEISGLKYSPSKTHLLKHDPSEISLFKHSPRLWLLSFSSARAAHAGIVSKVVRFWKKTIVTIGKIFDGRTQSAFICSYSEKGKVPKN